MILSAFGQLATAPRPDHGRVMDSFQAAKVPLPFGYGLLLPAAVGVAWAALITVMSSRWFTKTVVMFGPIGFVLLLAAVGWGQVSILSFPELLAE